MRKVSLFKVTTIDEDHPLAKQGDVVVSPLEMDLPESPADWAKLVGEASAEKPELNSLGSVWGWYKPTERALLNGLYLMISSKAKVDLEPQSASPLEIAQALLKIEKMTVDEFIKLPREAEPLAKWAAKAIKLLPKDHALLTPKADIPAGSRILRKEAWEAEKLAQKKIVAKA